jgi:hypothetical protein
MSWLKTPRKRVFFVKSAEQNPCPICDGSLKVIGSRHRGYTDSAGEAVDLIIRRLRCQDCHKIHHELPDILVPYKRHASESIEAVVVGDGDSVAADESTIRCWRRWFAEMASYLFGCLKSIAIRHGMGFAETPSQGPESALLGIWHYVGGAPGWLARVVRSVANSNLWLHTRSAFCP